jgi:hypothetical protein
MRNAQLRFGNQVTPRGTKQNKEQPPVFPLHHYDFLFFSFFILSYVGVNSIIWANCRAEGTTPAVYVTLGATYVPVAMSASSQLLLQMFCNGEAADATLAGPGGL